jgi:hypothetical protein
MAFAAHLSKVMYISRRGNSYLRPSIGIGISSYDIKEENGIDITSNLENYKWSSYYVPVSFGLGWNISPSVSLELKPGVFVRTAATTGNDNPINQSSSFPIDPWNFGTLDELTFNVFTVLNLRIRL